MLKIQQKQHQRVERQPDLNYYDSMTNALFAELLIPATLLPAALYAFSKNKKAVRAVPSLIPAAVLFIALTTAAYGMSASIFVLWVAVVFVFICNIPQLSRFFLGLTFDSTGLSYFVSVLQCLIILAAAVFCVVFRPAVPVSQQNSREIISRKYTLTRIAADRFVPKERFSQPAEAVLTVTSPPDADKNLPLLVYLPDIYANAEDCSATAAALAEEGFTVVLADFNLSGGHFNETAFFHIKIRPFISRMQDFFWPKYFSENRENGIEEKERELNALRAILQSGEIPAELQHRALYLIAEGNVKTLAENLKEQYPDEISGVYFMHTAQKPIPGYISGYGNLAVFHPFEAFLRQAGRDDKGIQAQTIARAVAEALSETN